ncbi:MAG: hypothetical protein ACNS63_04380 [Candidatus Nitrospinota bacterium M3_3B_026]
METKKVVITESELRDTLAELADELIEQAMERLLQMGAASAPEEIVESLDSNESGETGTSEPAEKPSSSNGNDGGESSGTRGYIKAVRTDGSAFRIREDWFNVNQHTRLEADLVKGGFVKVLYKERQTDEGGTIRYANAVYESQPRETAAA